MLFIYIYIYIYIYIIQRQTAIPRGQSIACDFTRCMMKKNIYIYKCHPQTDCFVVSTHQCGKTRAILQARIETRMTLRQPDIVPHGKRRILTYMYHFTFVSMDMETVCSFHERSFALREWQPVIPS